MARIALREVFNLTKSPTPPTAAFLDKVHQQIVRALDPNAGPFLVGYSTVVGNEQYLVVSFNGTLDDATAVGFSYDTTGVDPDFYIMAPGHSIVPLADRFDCANCHKGVVLPSLTTAQRDALTSVTDGTLIFNTTTNLLNFWDGAAWQAS